MMFQIAANILIPFYSQICRRPHFLTPFLSGTTGSSAAKRQGSANRPPSLGPQRADWADESVADADAANENHDPFECHITGYCLRSRWKSRKSCHLHGLNPVESQLFVGEGTPNASKKTQFLRAAVWSGGNHQSSTPVRHQRSRPGLCRIGGIDIGISSTCCNWGNNQMVTAGDSYPIPQWCLRILSPSNVAIVMLQLE